MLTHVEIDGELYHAQYEYDDDGNIVDTRLITDEDDQPIRSTICICHAFEPNECSCGAWDEWDDVTDWNYD
jgi:hypothetical protein